MNAATGLDEDTVERMVDLLNNSDLTCLIASHNADFLARTTDMVYRMENQKVLHRASEVSYVAEQKGSKLL